LIRAQDAKDYRLHGRHASRADIVACPEDFRYATASRPMVLTG
jgi:hypothetical protein